MIVDENNYLEMIRGNFLLTSLLLKYLSDRDPTLPAELEKSLAESENFLSKVKEPLRTELQQAVEVAKRALNEL